MSVSFSLLNPIEETLGANFSSISLTMMVFLATGSSFWILTIGLPTLLIVNSFFSLGLTIALFSDLSNPDSLANFF